MNDLFSRPDPQTTWRYLWIFLAIGFALRVAMSQTTDRIVFPDQVFQYLEPAYRLSFGYGIVTWEFVYGLRSWLIPLLIAAVLEIAKALGLGSAQFYVPMVEVTLCLISLFLPIGIYRLAQALLPERVAIVAFVLSIFWSWFIYYAHTAMPSMLGGISLVWLCVFMLRRPTTWQLVAIGLLSALTIALRFQLIPVVGLLNLFALYALGRKYIWIALGNVFVVTIVGLIDLWTWGGFLASYIDNFYYNFSEGISERFGTHRVWFYAWITFVETGGLIYAMLFGVLLMARRAWPIWLAIAVGILLLHIPAHKEHRFLVWIMPFGIIGLAHLLFWLHARIASHPLIRRGVVSFVVFWAFMASAIHILFEYDMFEGRPRIHELAGLIRAAGSDPDLTGLAIQTPYGGWGRAGGYFALGRPVPVYFPKRDDARNLNPDTVDFMHVSHIIAQDILVMDGYRVVAETHSLELWKSIDPKEPYGDKPYEFFVGPGIPLSEIIKPPRGVRFPPLPTRFPDQ